MNFPEDLKYTKEHEWARQKGGRVLVGITDFAQDQLGDVVYVELPAVGDEVKKGESFGVVESTKAVSELFAPISGRIGKSTVTDGALVTANQPAALAVIQQLSTIYVDITQSNAEILKLQQTLASGRLKKGGPEAPR